MGKHETKRRFNFKKFLKTYIIILTVLMVISLIYVVESLIKYENLQVEKFLNNTMDQVANAGRSGNISKYLDVSNFNLSKFEGENASKDKLIAEYIKSNEFTFKLDSESVDLNNPVYDALVGENAIFKIALNGEKKVTRLGILTFQDWKLDKVTLAKTDGLYECIIAAPSDYKVYVNNIQVTENEKTDGKLDEGLEELAKYANIPFMTKYTISGLINEPEVKIEDEKGNEAKYEKEDNIYKVALDFEEIQDEKEALNKINGDIDIMKIAKDWSLYLSNDLSGKLHGFYNINQYLIKDSYMYKYAYKWATNVDITFISSHTLDNPTFTNTKLSNFRIYNEKAFSCDVYLEKNMIIKGGNKLQDKMNERMYFAYYNGSWKLVNMQSITNN